MKRLTAVVLLFFAPLFPAGAQAPEMLPIPDSPVYYAPQVDANFFYYDGFFWSFADDRWYASPAYNGPWVYVDPVYVPTYVLWVPIRYYRRAPAYFHQWNANAPPRWTPHYRPRPPAQNSMQGQGYLYQPRQQAVRQPDERHGIAR